ncbi:MAG: transglycosylase domain-containing protein [Lawsonella clevelandensis]
MGRHDAPRTFGDRVGDTWAATQGKASLLAKDLSRKAGNTHDTHPQRGAGQAARQTSGGSQQRARRISVDALHTAGTRPAPASRGTASRGTTSRGSAAGQATAASRGGKPPRDGAPKKTRRPKAPRPPKKVTPKSVIAGIFKWIALLLLTTIVASVIFFVLMYIFVRVPAPGDIPTAQRVTLVASDGKTVLGNIIPEAGNRREVDASQIPGHLRHATMAAEDREFMTNKGFSFSGFGRAALGQLTGRSDTGGGSTITQQYVKNALVGNERSYWRKFKELVISMKMANQWSKQDIMTAYLNTIYFGRGAYGVDTAAQTYFGKPVHELTPSQSAMLAGLIQQPSNLDPRINPVASENRWKYVVRGMLREGWLTREEVAKMDFPKTLPENKNRTLDNRLSGPNGILKAQIMRELANHGFDEQTVTSEGLRIITTISPDARQAVIKAVQDTLKSQPKQMRAAAVTIDPQTGGVLAYYGGARAGDFDYADSPQMTGSSFKVFTLAAGLDQNIPLSKMYSSAPYKMGHITIENSEGMSCGTCTIASATVMSLNTSYYRLMMDLKNGPRDVRAMAYKAGIPREIPGYGKTLQNKDGYVEGGITLGAYPVRPLDMASAYGTFAARGIYHEPFFVKEAVANGGEGRTVYQHDQQSGERRVKEVVADNVTSALEPIASYSNGHGLAGGRPSAAKTGTVQLGSTGKNRDAWMVGYTPQASTAVWVGTRTAPPWKPVGSSSLGFHTALRHLESDHGRHSARRTVQVLPRPRAIDGQAGRPGYNYYYAPSETAEKDKKKKKRQHHEPSESKRTSATRPTFPGLPGVENPFAPPTTTTTTHQPDEDNPDEDGGVLWR